MKEEYEMLSESNKRIMEDELEMMKTNKEEDEQYIASLKIEYDHEITEMNEAHKN